MYLQSPAFSQIVEARQKCYEALPNILSTLGPKISADLGAPLVQTIYRALLAGLDDYTADERGDVGSWIRIACISGLVSVSKLLFSLSTHIDLAEFLPRDTYQDALGGLLKQGVERLDNVRAHAGEQVLSLVAYEAPDGWRMQEETVFRGLFMKCVACPLIPPLVTDGGTRRQGEERTSWADAMYVFPRAARLLAIPHYRSTLAYGLVLSIGSKTDSTVSFLDLNGLASHEFREATTRIQGSRGLRRLAPSHVRQSCDTDTPAARAGDTRYRQAQFRSQPDRRAGVPGAERAPRVGCAGTT